MATFNMTFQTQEQLNTDFEGVLPVVTNNYEDLQNKPSVNGTELVGDVTLYTLITDAEIREIS